MTKKEKEWLKDVMKIIGIEKIGNSFTYMMNKAIENIANSDNYKSASFGYESLQALCLEYHLGWDMYTDGDNPRIRNKKEVKWALRTDFNNPHVKLDVDKHLKNALCKIRSKEYRKHLVL